jgi:bifunctional N-acetylglucosamine-1-phosphate-uridyltransferase/glucosamine-1-phosphate-acetyltransferase GlmU-like protein
MVTREDFTKDYQLQAFADKAELLKHYQATISQHNQHQTILTIEHRDPKALCNDIANSEERLAALQISHSDATPLFYKRARQLASAEGAILVLDLTSEKEISSVAINNTQAEIILFKEKNYYLAINSKLETISNKPSWEALTQRA